MAENLTFAGFDTVALAKKYGTPLYVMSEDIIRDRIKAIRKAFDLTGVAYDINYAGKAFTNLAMCRIIASEGISLDTVSRGEIMTALKAGFPAERICFHGNNKRVDELRYAVEYGVGHIVVDSEDELARLETIQAETGAEIAIMFRISPGVEAHTHELIQTGTEDSKFGIPYQQAKAVVRKASQMRGITVDGLHCHIGSQIVDDKPFVLAADRMLSLYQALVQDGVPLTTLNLGGGFGIPYLRGDERFDTLKYIPKLVDHVRQWCLAKGLACPKLVVEPGRFIACEAGVTLYTVGTVKTIPGVRKYVAIDGGMNDNPRPALYGAQYEAFICNGKAEEQLESCRISGRACENDQLIAEMPLNQPTMGDTLMVTNTGAYNYTMASVYNRFGRPAVVLLSGDRDAVIVERETDEELLHFDRVPEWL